MPFTEPVLVACHITGEPYVGFTEYLATHTGDGSPINNVLRRGIDVSRWQGEVNWSQDPLAASCQIFFIFHAYISSVL